MSFHMVYTEKEAQHGYENVFCWNYMLRYNDVEHKNSRAEI